MSKADGRNVPITVGGTTVLPNATRRLELPFARLPTGTWLSLPVSVVNGRWAGPTIWLSGAVHGDEINGVAIIRRVLRRLKHSQLHGAVIAVPIVNVFGFVNESRYLPDRRDLNRVFPGSARGSMASRLAHLFVSEVVTHSDVGIDLHTATSHRINTPQVRADLSDADTRQLAAAFGAPFMINASLRDGSLREAAIKAGKRVLLYEAGQAHRFDREAIEIGVSGVLRTMQSLGMGDWSEPAPDHPSQELGATSWVRARRSGIAEFDIALGDFVEKGDPLVSVSDAFGSKPARIRAPFGGWVIARTLNPLVSQGDGLVHIGASEGGEERAQRPDVGRARSG